MTLLCPLPGCRFVRVVRDGPGALTVLAQARHDHARCPMCRTLSTSVHSRYHRRPTDLLVSGNAVRLQLAVRRFYCRDPACPRHTFAERFPCHGQRGPGRSILDPHLDHLHARHREGCENAMQLWRELRRLGFLGTAKQVQRWLSERRTRPAKTTIRRLQVPSVVAPTAPTSSPSLPSTKQLSWHLLREPDSSSLTSDG